MNSKSPSSQPQGQSCPRITGTGALVIWTAFKPLPVPSSCESSESPLSPHLAKPPFASVTRQISAPFKMLFKAPILYELPPDQSHLAPDTPVIPRTPLYTRRLVSPPFTRHRAFL